jgi:hypothetical protein
MSIDSELCAGTTEGVGGGLSVVAGGLSVVAGGVELEGRKVATGVAEFCERLGVGEAAGW